MVAEILVAKVLLGAPVAAERLLAADQRQARGPAESSAEAAVAAPRREVAAFVRDHAAERGADALPGLVLFTEHWLAEVPAAPCLAGVLPLLRRDVEESDGATCITLSSHWALQSCHHTIFTVAPKPISPTCKHVMLGPEECRIFSCRSAQPRSLPCSLSLTTRV